MAEPGGPHSRDEFHEMAQAARQRILDSGLPFPCDEDLGPASRGAETKQRILAVAITLCGERGIEACTMRDIATEAGIKAPAIYNHYGSKEEVLAAAMEDILGRFFWGQVASLGDFPIEDWLEQIVTRHVRFQLRHRRQADASDAVLNGPAKKDNLPTPTYRRLVGLQRDYADLFCVLIQAAWPTADRTQAMMAGFAMAAMCDRVSGWHNPKGQLSIEEIAERQWVLARQMIDP
ncbi:MAG TPA: TetR/AcrR family transcriptional regulator [Solirubrobacterales bacterium]|nr:TetR/AcrR family transcriptional regulator [Solirubrobacterales bacterium]